MTIYYLVGWFNININYLGKKQTKSFLDILLNVSKEQPDQMPYDGIREEVETFLFEGHDTSSISIIMTLTLLALHPDIQVINKYIIYFPAFRLFQYNIVLRTKLEMNYVKFLITQIET